MEKQKVFSKNIYIGRRAVKPMRQSRVTEDSGSRNVWIVNGCLKAERIEMRISETIKHIYN